MPHRHRLESRRKVLDLLRSQDEWSPTSSPQVSMSPNRPPTTVLGQEFIGTGPEAWAELDRERLAAVCRIAELATELAIAMCSTEVLKPMAD